MRYGKIKLFFLEDRGLIQEIKSWLSETQWSENQILIGNDSVVYNIKP